MLSLVFVIQQPVKHTENIKHLNVNKSVFKRLNLFVTLYKLYFYIVSEHNNSSDTI